MNAKIIYRQKKRSLKCLARLEGIIMNARIVCRKRKRSLQRIRPTGQRHNERIDLTQPSIRQTDKRQSNDLER